MKKIALSLAVAGVMSGALASEVPNLANIAPDNYGKFVPTIDLHAKGKDIFGDASFGIGIDGKFGLIQALSGELYLRVAAQGGYKGASAQRYISGSGGLGWSQKLSENQFVALEANYKYGVATGGKLTDLKNWSEYGVTATYGYKFADWFTMGASGFYDKTNYDLYAVKGIKGSTYGFGVPLSISITKTGNLNIYGGYQTQKIDDSNIKKSQPVVSLGVTVKF